MPDRNSPARTLQQHFFRRFFDNDTLSLEAETETSVIRALAACAVPALMVAFWLLPRYPGRALWAVAADRYFFVVYSFVVMGIVSTIEWEMLFPDRADFLILLPMPLKSHELFYAKGKALLSFLGMFLVAANVFALILFSAVSTPGRGNYLHSAWAHLAAVTLSGVFAALTMLAVKGLSICFVPAGWYRPFSLGIQSLSITLLLGLLLVFPLVGSHMQILLGGHAGFAKFIPPLWFLGLYERLILGPLAPAGAESLSRIGLGATAVVALLAVGTYPAAWSRQKRRALEGSSGSHFGDTTVVSRLLHMGLFPRAQQRAVFHFIGQTIARNIRYQVYLAIYAGIGLALAFCFLLTFRLPAHGEGEILSLGLSNSGLHALLPLLLFWLVSGLKAAFGFPVDMLARWVFPISLAPPMSYAAPQYPGPDAKAAKTFTQLCCGLLTSITLCILLLLHWSFKDLTIQAVCGVGLSILLADLFFLGRTQIPFTRPRLPGRTNLGIVFTLYTVFFPALVYCTVQLEFAAEVRLNYLAWIVAGVASSHLVLKTVDRLAQRGIIGGFPEDEEDEGPQTLGLSQ